MKIPLLYPSFPVTNGKLAWTKGLHDYMDQFICLYGRALNYTTILFQRELGEHRATTEILDVRPYAAQYAYFLTQLPKMPFPVSKQVPTVWFGEFGLANMKTKLVEGEHTVLGPVQCSKLTAAEKTRCKPPFIGSHVRECFEVVQEWVGMLLEELQTIKEVSLHTYNERNTYMFAIPPYTKATISWADDSVGVDVDLWLNPEGKSVPLKEAGAKVQQALERLYQREASNRGLITLRIFFHLSDTFNIDKKQEKEDVRYLKRAVRFGEVQIEFPAGTLWRDFAPFGHVQLYTEDRSVQISLVFTIPFQFPARN